MADIKVDGDELVVELSGPEKLEAVHGDIRVPLSLVRAVEVVDDAVHAVNAFTKLIGSSWPGRFVIGTFFWDGQKTFAVVHHDTPQGVEVMLDGAHFDRLLVGCAAPGAVVALVRSAAGLPPG